MSRIHTNANYKECLKKSGLKKGDKIKITLLMDFEGQFGCGCYWLGEMDKYVNTEKIYTIKEFTDSGNIRIDGTSWVFPFFCVERVE